MHRARTLQWICSLRELLACSGLLGALGCTGVIDGSQDAPSATPAGEETPSGGGASEPSSTEPLDCASPQAAVLHARLLTPSQYDHAVEDLFRVGGQPAKDFGGGVAALLDEVEVERRATAAAQVATQAAQTLSSWSPCSPPTAETAECGATIVGYLGRAAFRHPLSETERLALQTLFDAGLSESGFATGVEWLLTGLLQAPDFLYQFAKPLPGEQAGQIVPLAAHELASRLSLFVWDGLPDEALLGAAESGTLADDAGLEGEILRLLADPRFERGAAAYYADWLGLEGFREVARDDAALTSELIALLERSLLVGATSIYASSAPNFASLFSGDSYYLNDALRAFYGLGGGSGELEPVPMPNESRQGILTHPGLLTLLARPAASDPIARGLFVQRTLLCNEIPPPPDGVAIPPLAPASDGLSTRARLEQHTSEAFCAGCHAVFDPPGFALENFDQVGRFRTTDGGVPVDTSGEMTTAGDLDGPFASGGELLARIANSQTVKRCFAEHYLTHAVSRVLTTADGCALDGVQSGFAETGDLKQLIVAVAKSDAFRLRATEDLGAMP